MARFLPICLGKMGSPVSYLGGRPVNGQISANFLGEDGAGGQMVEGRGRFHLLIHLDTHDSINISLCLSR